MWISVNRSAKCLDAKSRWKRNFVSVDKPLIVCRKKFRKLKIFIFHFLGFIRSLCYAAPIGAPKRPGARSSLLTRFQGDVLIFFIVVKVSFRSWTSSSFLWPGAWCTSALLASSGQSSLITSVIDNSVKFSWFKFLQFRICFNEHYLIWLFNSIWSSDSDDVQGDLFRNF